MALVNNFGVLLPTRGVLVYADSGGPRVELTWQMAETAERAGYDSVWVGDSITSKPRLEPLTAMAAIAARTNRGQGRNCRPAQRPAPSRPPGPRRSHHRQHLGRAHRPGTGRGSQQQPDVRR